MKDKQAASALAARVARTAVDQVSSLLSALAVMIDAAAAAAGTVVIIDGPASGSAAAAGPPGTANAIDPQDPSATITLRELKRREARAAQIDAANAQLRLELNMSRADVESKVAAEAAAQAERHAAAQRRTEGKAQADADVIRGRMHAALLAQARALGIERELVADLARTRRLHGHLDVAAMQSVLTALLPAALARRSEKGDVCGKPLDNNLLHISTCNCGPMRHRPHESAKFALHKALRRTAAQQDLERHVPELYTRDHEAIMDLCVTWPGRPDTFFLDLTVKATSAIKHARKREDAGAARRAGVQLKRTRYGNSVDAIVITHFGRLAEESRDALRRIAEASRLWAPPRLGARPGATASYLQLVVEGAVIRAVADAHLLALGAAGGKAVGWRRASRAGPAAIAERRSAEPEADAAWAQLDGDEPANEELEAALAQFEAEELAAELAEVEAAEAAVAAAVAARAAPEDEWEHEGGLDAETER